MTPPQLANPAPGLKAKAKANPQLVVGAGAVAVVIAVALMSKKGAGTDGAEADTTPGASSGQITPNQGGYYDSTANDVYNSLNSQLQGLQSQISELSDGPSTPIPAPIAPKPTVPKPVVPAPVKKPITKPLPKPKIGITRKPAPVKRAQPFIPKTYTVKAGDNLTAISRRLYGSADWHKLYNANLSVIGKNPNLIKPGQKLKV